MDRIIVKSGGVITAVAILWTTSTAYAQAPQETAPPASAQQTTTTEQPNGSASPEMREMAKSMKSMADMCQTMMQQEMQHRPLLIVAVAVLGTVLSVSLVLFVVLEVQWIRYWNLRIRIEYKTLG